MHRNSMVGQLTEVRAMPDTRRPVALPSTGDFVLLSRLFLRALEVENRSSKTIDI